MSNHKLLPVNVGGVATAFVSHNDDYNVKRTFSKSLKKQKKVKRKKNRRPWW